MIRINLLPEDVLRRGETPPIVLFFIPPLLALLLSTGLFFRLFNEKKSVEKEIAAAQAELAKFKNIQAEFERVKAELTRLESRIAFITKARAKQSFWLEALTSFTQLMPPNTVLDGLTIGPSGEITLSGRTDRFSTVSQFIRILNGSPMFTNAQVGGVSKSYGQGGEELGITSFNMTVQFLPKEERKKLQLEKKS